MQADPTFNRVPIEPLDCWIESWDIVSRQYRVFLAAGAIVLVSALPFGALAGPCLVGVHRMLQEGDAGRVSRLTRVFDGLHRWKPALCASLIMAGVAFAVFVPIRLAFIAGAVASFGMAENVGADASPLLEPMWFVVSLLMACVMAMALVPFTFCFQLLAERRISGVEAVLLSARAARANVRGLAGLWLVCALICAPAAMLYGLPLVFVFPFALGALHVAYRRVFGKQAAERAAPLRAAS